jgi:hypothetical protein
MTTKESKAAIAKEKYNNNKEPEQRRKFIYRIKQGNVPNLTSMAKYGLTLETINDLRKEVKLKPLNNTDIRGQLKKKMEMMISNEEDVLKDVIPNVYTYTCVYIRIRMHVPLYPTSYICIYIHMYACMYDIYIARQHRKCRSRKHTHTHHLQAPAQSTRKRFLS